MDHWNLNSWCVRPFIGIHWFMHCRSLGFPSMHENALEIFFGLVSVVPERRPESVLSDSDVTLVQPVRPVLCQDLGMSHNDFIVIINPTKKNQKWGMDQTSVWPVWLLWIINLLNLDYIGSVSHSSCMYQNASFANSRVNSQNYNRGLCLLSL